MQNTTVFFLLQAYFPMSESWMPTKSSRASKDTSQVQATADETIPDDFLQYHKQPPRLEVDITTLVIDKQKKYGQIENYRQT